MNIFTKITNGFNGTFETTVESPDDFLILYSSTLSIVGVTRSFVDLLLNNASLVLINGVAV